MPNATQEQSDREALMRSLAGRLEFAVQKIGDCFTLLRTVDVVPPVCAEGMRLPAPLGPARPRVREKTLKNFPRSMHLLALSDRPNPKLSPRSRSATGSEGDG
jgi:hypothetical protein